MTNSKTRQYVGRATRARLLSWRSLRWAIAIPTLPLVWWACTSHPLTQPPPSPVMQTDVYVSVAPIRDLDLVFMVDNSPSMGPKQAKMNTQMKKLIGALEDPTDHTTLPNLRVAIIDSDLGTGGAYNDERNPCAPNKKNGFGSYGDQGRFQMIDAKNCGVTVDGAQWLEYNNGKPVNYSGDINAVFACLANNLGTNGCGEEHQLQAFEFALALKGVGNDEQQAKFLRKDAYLGLVFLSDEDDCSAAFNYGMFGDYDTLKNESPSLRCATRAHTCNGKNLTDAPPGYPTTAAFSTAFSNCDARLDKDGQPQDSCPNQTDGAAYTDTSQPTTCNPLKSVRHLAAEIKSLKSKPDEQILVAGIFGWPLSDADMATATYKIDKIPNPNTQDLSHPLIYDYWPVCYDPEHPAPQDGSYDARAAGIGATGGLRMSAFIDEFGKNGLKFSICQTDFTDSMQKIGEAIARHLQDLCVNYKLMDSDLAQPGLQPDCQVVYQVPTPAKEDPTKVVLEPSDKLKECPPGSTNYAVATDCWQLTTDQNAWDKCKESGQLITVLRTADEKNTPLTPGTLIGMNCLTCTDDIPGESHTSDRYRKCHY